MEPDPQQTVPGMTIRLATRHDIAAMMTLEAHHYVGNLGASERPGCRRLHLGPAPAGLVHLGGELRRHPRRGRGQRELR